jgi:hypothetical protein
MPTRIQARRGTASEWTTANPTLSAGELGFETDTGLFKIGNGADNWSTLSYSTTAIEEPFNSESSVIFGRMFL